MPVYNLSFFDYIHIPHRGNKLFKPVVDKYNETFPKNGDVLLAARPGLEPEKPDPNSGVLPITPPGNINYGRVLCKLK